MIFTVVCVKHSTTDLGVLRLLWPWVIIIVRRFVFGINIDLGRNKL